MRRLFLIVFLLLGVLAPRAQIQETRAQSFTPAPGDPPVLARITLALGANGSVTVGGASGAVFPNAYVAVRNLHTGATVYTHAGGAGGFSVQIEGTLSTPFWISPSTVEQRAADEAPGSLSGGPGVIFYSLSPDANPPTSPRPITPISIDGDLSDWNADDLRLDEGTRDVYALRNADSLYVALAGIYVNGTYARVEIRLTIDTNTYTVTLDPRTAQAADLQRVNPSAHVLGTLSVAARQARAIEMRIPLSFVDSATRVRLDGVRWLDAEGEQIASDPVDAELPALDAVDGITRPLAASVPAGTGTGTPFALAQVGWTVNGVIDSLALNPGASLSLRMNINLSTNASTLPAEARISGTIALQPIASLRDNDEMLAVSGAGTNNGWSSALTPSGLPIDNAGAAILLGEASAEPAQLLRRANGLAFPLDFALRLPDDLPPGLYVPVFSGATLSGEAAAPWTESTRLPLIVNVGGVVNAHLLWALFADNPSDGSRGILTDEDQVYAGLSNRVRFNAPTYILPPFEAGTGEPIPYPLEPYLLNQLPNSYSSLGTPLIPFQFPDGTLHAVVTRPNGSHDDLGELPIAQNQLSTAAQDERALFGSQSPVDEYRLTTLDPRYTGYTFDQYGEYQIALSGSLRDQWGVSYTGGGTYTVLAADLLDLTPGVLPGTPFFVGDALNFGLRLSPGVPADVTVKVTLYPLNGSMVTTHTVTGTTNAHGYFQPNGETFRFAVPGEYTLDYEARYTDAGGRLWAASARGAGVVVSPDAAIVAHGQRGLPDVLDVHPPAWFSAEQYAPEHGDAFSFPYHSGDVAWVLDGSASTFQPTLRVQDLGSGYSQWLRESLPDTDMRQRASEGDLPVLGDNSYRYVSAVRPNVTVRQFIAAEDGSLSLGWDEDDPLNRQIGAGSDGSAPGDVLFLFGGAVVRAGGVRETSAYAALAIIMDGEPPRVFPPDRGAAGGSDGGALLTIGGQAVDTFITLTGVQPGEALALGDTIAITGQVAPPLAATVSTTLIAPSGAVYPFTGRSSPVGTYYHPEHVLTLDEPGIWTVSVRVQQDGVSSAGQIEPPYPTGSVLGLSNERFPIYVLPADAEPLPWNPLLTDTLIPIVSPYNFSFTLPEGWTNLQAYYALTTPGYVIEQGEIHVSGRSFNYAYAAPLQSRILPNLENEGRSGAYLSDVRTLTFVATGVDASGEPQMRSRTFTLMHDRLITTG